MSLSDGLNEKRDILANVAARLRNQVASTSTRSPKKENHRPSPHRSPRGSMSSSRSSARGTSSVRGDDDVKMTDITAGPSLFGTADQLLAAKQFLATATSGGQRSRPPRSGRHRLLTHHASHSSLQSSSSSVHTTKSTPAATQHAPFQPQRPLPPFGSPLSSKSVNVATPSTRPSVQLATNRPPPIPSWDAFAKQPVPSATVKTGNGAATVQTQTTNHTHAHPETLHVTKEQVADPRSAFADRAKSLRNGTEGSKMPPHLKYQAAAAGIPERKTPVPAAAGNVAASGVLSNMNNAHVGTAASQSSPSPAKSVAAPKVADVVPTSPSKKRKTESLDAVEKQTAINSTSTTAVAAAAASSYGGSKTNGEMSDTNGIIAAVQLELSAVTKRLTTLELEFQKQVETLMQAEERRVFLGTSSAKAPFGLEVKLSNGSTCVVQAHQELKVADLVRRIRCKANLSHETTKNPTIIVNGQEVGHGMMLGEVGVGSDKQVSVDFRFSG